MKRSVKCSVKIAMIAFMMTAVALLASTQANAIAIPVVRSGIGPTLNSAADATEFYSA